MSKHANGRWNGCKANRPCEICGSKHWCAYSTDGVWSKCRYNLTAPDAMAGHDEMGDFAMYAHDGGAGRDPARRPARPEVAEPARADAAFCSEVYDFVLAQLELWPEHQQKLITRGLTKDQIATAGFRSLPSGLRKNLCRAVREKFGDRALEVPGFYKNDQGRLLLAGDEGLVVPVRDVAGRVVALKVRRDLVDDDGPKYRVVSSSSKGGPSPGSPVHVPHFEGDRATVRVTEGELKAEVLTALTGVLTVSIPGATSLSGLVPVLKALDAKTVVLAWDADKSKRHEPDGKLRPNWVARGLERAAHLLAAEGLAIELEHWPEENGKGLDDVMQAGRGAAVQKLTGRDAWGCIAATLRATGGEPDAATLARAGLPPPAPPVQPPRLPGRGPELPEGNAGGDAGDGGAGAAGPRPPRPERAAGPVFNLGDDPEIADQLLVDLRRGSPEPLVADLDALWRYEAPRGVWVMLKKNDLFVAVARYSGRLVRAGADRDGDEKFKPLKLKKGQIEGIVQTAEQFAARPGFFDAARDGCAFVNGFVTVDDAGAIRVEPHSPAHRARHAMPWDYDEQAPCDQWLKFFDEVFLADPTAAENKAPNDPAVPRDVEEVKTPDKLRQACEEAVGAALMGLATRYAKAIVLFGPQGSNGKSTFIKALQQLFARDAIAALPPQLWTDKFSVHSLINKQINLIGELPARDVQDSSAFKAIITGDDVYTEPKGKQGFRFQPRAAHFFSANGLPGTNDTSDAFWRRFLVIPWLRTFKEDEAKLDMTERLLGQLQGFAALCVQGASRLVTNKHYTLGDASKEALSEWKLEADQIRQYVDERAAVDPAGELDLKAIYVDYVAWAKRTGHGSLSRTSLGTRLRQLGHYHRKTSGRFYRLRLLELPAEDRAADDERTYSARRRSHPDQQQFKPS